MLVGHTELLNPWYRYQNIRDHNSVLSKKANRLNMCSLTPGDRGWYICNMYVIKSTWVSFKINMLKCLSTINQRWPLLVNVMVQNPCIACRAFHPSPYFFYFLPRRVRKGVRIGCSRRKTRDYPNVICIYIVIEYLYVSLSCMVDSFGIF